MAATGTGNGDERLQEISNTHSGTVLSKFDYTYSPVGTIATWQQQQDTNPPTVYGLGYDAADQLTSAVQTNTSTNATVSSNAYHYDPAGNRLVEVTATNTAAGQFNTLNQLTGLGTTTSSQTIAGNTSSPVSTVTVNAVPATVSNQTNFSANVSLPGGTNTVSVVATPSTGNVTTKRYQVVTTGNTSTTLTYDADGNTLTDESGNSYQWDALSRLTKITYPSGASSLFGYDGLSRRIQIVEKNSSGTVTSTKNELWIGQEMAEERDTSNTVTKRFFPQGEQQAGTAYYYTRDHLGSVREMLNSSGTIVARYQYDPYGRTTLVSGSSLATFQYTGDYYHAASGMNLTRGGDGQSTGRAYDSNVGRWLSRDPIEESGGLNLYGYVGDDPIDWYDPFGLKLCWKRVLVSRFNDPRGDHGPHNGVRLGPGDAASGNRGYTPNDFDRNGNVLPGHVITHKNLAYPDGSQFTIHHSDGTTNNVTINDNGAGYAERRPHVNAPNGVPADSWFDEWTPTGNEGPEWLWVSQTVADTCPCPPGWGATHQ